MTDTMQIYVADLAAYNAGHLHGAWIDLEEQSFDAENVHAEIAKILLKSPAPNVLVTCPECEGEDSEKCTSCKGAGEVPSAEEFAIHDHQGLGSDIGEYSAIDEVCELAEFLHEHEDAARAALAVDGELEFAKNRIENGYSVAEDYADYAQQYAEDQGLEVPSFFCIDWDQTGRELAMGCSTVRLGSQLFIFNE